MNSLTGPAAAVSQVLRGVKLKNIVVSQKCVASKHPDTILAEGVEMVDHTADDCIAHEARMDANAQT